MDDGERIRTELYYSMRSPGLNPQNVFYLLHALLKREFPETREEDLEKKSAAFHAMVRKPFPDGLEMDPAQLLKWVKEFKHPHEIAGQQNKKIVNEMKWMRERVLRLLPGVAPEHVGKGHRADNISPSYGTDPTYIQRRLNRDRPDLAERVAKGELSAHAAAIEAGFRRKLSPLEQILKLLPKLTDKERAIVRGEAKKKPIPPPGFLKAEGWRITTKENHDNH